MSHRDTARGRAGAGVSAVAFAFGMFCASLPLSAARAADPEIAAATVAAYDVPPECAAREAWLAALRARLPALLQTHPLLEQLAVRVVRERRAGAASYEGALSGADELLGSGQRRLRGGSCEEVLDALSFVAALALQRAPAAPPSASRVAAAPPPVVDDGRAPLPVVVAPERGSELGAQAFVLLQEGLSGVSALAAGAGVQLAWTGPHWQPFLLLGAHLGGDDERLAAGGTARLRLGSLHTVACPWRWSLLAALALRPCAELELGVLSGEASRVPEAERQLAPWISAGLQLRAEVVLGRRWQLGAWLGGAVPLRHARFYFRPDVTVFETPPIGLRAGSFVGLLF